MLSVMHRIKINASPEQVYQALTTAEGLRNWWTRDAVISPEVGASGEFGFYGHSFVIKAKVEALRAPTHVAWNSISSTHGGFDGTTIAFDVSKEDGQTVLAFAHGGFKTADTNYAGATTRWGFYLLSLKSYLETGTGTPNPDDIYL